MSTISGSTTTSDLITLVQNLQTTVNNVSNSFSSIQTSIAQINSYDTTNNVALNNIQIADGQMQSNLAQLDIDDTNTLLRLTVLESKFPISNASILDQTISENKIQGLPNDLLNLNTLCSGLQNQITNLNGQETNDVALLTTNLNVQIAKEIVDINAQNTKWSVLNGSVSGTNTNPFQPQIDIIKSNQISDESAISVNTTNISSLQSSNSTNINNISSLQSSNAVNVSNINQLTQNLSTANTNIANNLTTLTGTNSSLSSQIAKESQDITNLQNQITNLTSNTSNYNNTLSLNLTAQVNKEQTDVTNLQALITTLTNTEVSDVSLLTTNLSNQVGKELSDFNNLNTLVNALTTKENSDISQVNSNFTGYQTLNNNRLTADEVILSNNSANIITNTNSINTLNSQMSVNTTNISSNASLLNTVNSKQGVDETNILNNTNSINTINSKLVTDEALITQNCSDIVIIKNYDITNTNNLNTTNINVQSNTTDINNLKTLTIPNLNNLYLNKSGDTMSGPLIANTIDTALNGIITIGQSSANINIGGSSSQAQTITIGNGNCTVNILGQTNNIETTNTSIKDKNIVLNQGAVGNSVSGGSGLNFYDNGLENAGYIQVSNDTLNFEFKPSGNDNVFRITQSPSDIYDLIPLLHYDTGISSLQASITGLLSTTSGLTTDIAIINNNVLNNTPFSKISAFPSTNSYVISGDGSMQKVNNNQIVDNSLNPTKLVGCSGDATKVLFSDGTFKVLPSVGGLGLSNVNFGGYQLNNISNGIINSDVVNLGQTNSLISTAISNIIPFDPSTLLLNNISCNNSVNLLNNNIINCLAPINPLDVSNKTYVDGKISTAINAISIPTLDTLSGTNTNNFNVNNHKIINLLTPTLGSDGCNKTYVDSAISSITVPTILSQLNNNADLNINTHKIINVSLPTVSTDVSTKGYVDTAISSIVVPTTYSQLSNTTDLNANSHKIINLLTPTLGTDGTNKTYVDSKFSSIVVPTTISQLSNTTDLNINTHKIINVIDPVNNQDVATKYYVDSHVGTGGTGGGGTTHTYDGFLSSSSNQFNINAQLSMVSNNIINVLDPDSLSNNYLQSATTVNYIKNIVFGAINNYLINNSIGLQKLLFTGDGTKILCSDGNFRLKQLPFCTGIQCKLLIIYNDMQNDLIQSNINNLILSLGGDINLCKVNCVCLNDGDISSFGTNGYDSSYDAILYWDNYLPLSDTVNILNTWHTNGKGVVLAQLADSGNNTVNNNLFVNVSSVITTSGQFNNYQNPCPQNSSNIILSGVDTINPYMCSPTFSAVNGAIGAGVLENNSCALTMLDSISYGRRVDLNLFPHYVMINDITTNNELRCIFNALLWAAKKIN